MFKLNKFDDIWGCTEMYKLNKFDDIWGAREVPVRRDAWNRARLLYEYPSLDRQNDCVAV